MRVQKKSSKKALIITILSVLLIAGVGVGTYALLSQSDKAEDSSSTNNDSRSRTNNSETEPNNGTSANNPDTTSHESEKDIPPSYEGENVDNSQTLTGVINYKSVVDGNVVIRTTINQMLGSGTCSLTLSNGQRTVTRSSGIVQNPSSSTCEGFSVPTSELGSGSWDINIQVASDNRTGTLSDSISL